MCKDYECLCFDDHESCEKEYQELRKLAEKLLEQVIEDHKNHHIYEKELCGDYCMGKDLIARASELLGKEN